MLKGPHEPTLCFPFLGYLRYAARNVWGDLCERDLGRPHARLEKKTCNNYEKEIHADFKIWRIREPISIALTCPNLFNIGRQSPKIECAFAKHLDFIIACVDCLQTVAHGIATSFRVSFDGIQRSLLFACRCFASLAWQVRKAFAVGWQFGFFGDENRKAVFDLETEFALLADECILFFSKSRVRRIHRTTQQFHELLTEHLFTFCLRPPITW